MIVYVSGLLVSLSWLSVLNIHVEKYVYMLHYCFSPGVIVTDIHKRGGFSDDKYSQVNIYIWTLEIALVVIATNVQLFSSYWS